MTDPITSQHESVSAGTSTVTVVSADTQDHPPTLHLRLRKPKTGRKVKWTTETVDNEEMNKKKSKSCCIYKKPKEFGESSSSEDSSDEDCDHHKESDKKKNTSTKDANTTVNGEESLTLTETNTSNPIEENAPIPYQEP